MTAIPEHSLNQLGERAAQALEIGARLQHGPSQRLIDTAFRRELEAQLPLFDAVSRVDLAHTLVLIENNIMPVQDGQALLAALLQLRQCPADFQPQAAHGDIYTNREVWLTSHASAAGWLGTGRARREAITTAYIIKQRELVLDLIDALHGYLETLIARSEQGKALLMSDYTYLQSAQPTSFGHYLLGFAFPALRDLDRLQALYARLNLSPAGCGSNNGSRIPQSRQRLAELLGFDGLVTHARDAMWQADLPIETAAVLSTITVNLDRLAEDIQILATDEFGLLALDDQHARASKIMPQKKNPFALTHIRGLANNLIGFLASAAAMGRTTTGQPDNRLQLYGMLPQSTIDVSDAIELMSEILANLIFNHQHALEKIDHGFCLATDLAEVLVLKTGLSFREAHKLVGMLVKRHLPTGHFNDLTLAEIANCANELFGKTISLETVDLNLALNPYAAVEARQETGCAASANMADMLEQCRQSLFQSRQWRSEQIQRLENAEVMLEQAIQQQLNSVTPI